MNPQFGLRERYLAAKYPFGRLLAPTGGMFSGVMRLANEPTAPDFEIAVSKLGNLTKVFPHVTTAEGRDALDEPLGGAGADVTTELAWVRAVMEGAERYATMAYRPEDFVLASARDLGGDAIDLDRIACCSEREYATPGCPYVRADKNAAIRWTRGYSLGSRRERYVPAVMSHLHLKPLPGERFWQQISTGVAAHARPAAAMVSAICEVIERDAIAIVWLARLKLARVAFGRPLPPELAVNLRVLERSLVRQEFFDATSDVGVPTIYAVQTLEQDPAISQYVSCAVAFEASEACAKTIREGAPARPVLRQTSGVPADAEDFRSLHDGAHELGKPRYRGAFDFLLQAPRSVELGAIRNPAGPSETEQLRYLVDRLSSLGFDVILVDLTTDELRDLGIWVVRAVVPGLMPMSSVQRGRFLGTPRLYDYPEAAGFGRPLEADLNPLPQPFA